MPISDVIRERRKALGLTQEQVADRLGVTAPAVNKWERGGTYPDIMMLAPLARLLETDVNSLLCFREELTEAEISEFCSKLSEVMIRDGIDAGTALADKKICEYPTCMPLIYQITMTLQGGFIFAAAELKSEADEEYNRKYDENILRRYEYIVENCEEYRVKNGAAFMLAGEYIRREQYEKAEDILNQLPEREADKRHLQAQVLMGQGRLDEAGRILEGGVLGNINEVHMHLMKLLDIAMEEGDEKRAEEIVKAGAQMAEVFQLGSYTPVLLPLELAVKRRDSGRAVKYIRQVMETPLEYWKPSKGGIYSHIRTKRQSGSQTEKNREALAMEKIYSTLFLEIQTSPEYEFLKENEEFRKFTDEYREKLARQERKRMSGEEKERQE